MKTPRAILAIAPAIVLALSGCGAFQQSGSANDPVSVSDVMQEDSSAPEATTQVTDGAGSEGADQTNAVEYSSTDYSDTLLVGDSVMSFASGVLEETLPNSTVDAVAGRSAETGGDTEGLTEDRGVFDQLRNADTSTYRRYVISLGNNDWEGVYYDDLKPVVDQLLDSRDDARVVLVTMMVTNNETSTANTNEAMQRIASEDDRVKIADWYTVAAMNPELISDNCHPTYYETSDDGCSTYAAIIKAALDS